MCESVDLASIVSQTAIDFDSSFISSKEMKFSPDQVSAELNIPAFMFDRLCLESNGFCGCEPILDSDGQLEAYSEV